MQYSKDQESWRIKYAVEKEENVIVDGDFGGERDEEHNKTSSRSRRQLGNVEEMSLGGYKWHCRVVRHIYIYSVRRLCKKVQKNKELL